MSRGIKLEWFGDKILKDVRSGLAVASKEIAEKIARDAKQRLATEPKEATGDLASQIEVRKSIFPDGGYIVGCQLTGTWKPPYRASFVELGAYSSEWGRHKKGSKTGTYMPAIPFLRPAAHKNKRGAKGTFQGAINKQLSKK